MPADIIKTPVAPVWTLVAGQKMLRYNIEMPVDAFKTPVATVRTPVDGLEIPVDGKKYLSPLPGRRLQKN